MSRRGKETPGKALDAEGQRASTDKSALKEGEAHERMNP
jgi:hypothetical protein